MYIQELKYTGCAIYSMYNNVSEKMYIGKTVNYRKRAEEHKSRLKNKKHCNQYLQNAYTLHPEAFSIFVVEVCEKEKLAEREVFWIKFLDIRNREKGYNITDGGEGAPGPAWTEERKEKWRESNRKFFNTEEGLKLREYRRILLKERIKIKHPSAGRVMTEEKRELIKKKLKETYKKKAKDGWVPHNGTRIEILDDKRNIVAQSNSIMTIDPKFGINPATTLAKISRLKGQGVEWSELKFRFSKYIIKRV